MIKVMVIMWQSSNVTFRDKQVFGKSDTFTSNPLIRLLQNLQEVFTEFGTTQTVQVKVDGMINDEKLVCDVGEYKLHFSLLQI